MTKSPTERPATAQSGVSRRLPPPLTLIDATSIDFGYRRRQASTIRLSASASEHSAGL
jgi:hypothetical protein